MKLKNISFAEKHVEKIIFLIGVLFCLYVIWAYFLSNRFSVSLNGMAIAPSKVDDQILDRAKFLETKLNGPAPDFLVNFKIPDSLGAFTRTLTASTTPVGPNGDPNTLSFAMLSGPGLDFKTKIDERDDDQRINPDNPPYAMPNLPVPSSLATRSDLGTLAISANPPEVLRAFGNQPPLDIEWVTVAARVDIASLVAQLTAPPPDNTQAIRTDTWQKNLALLDVQIERRTHNADGSWSDPVIIPAMPGRSSLRGAIPTVNVSTYNTTVDAARSNLPQIIQPTFYTLRNSTWTPPQPTEPAAEAEPGAAEPGANADLAQLQNTLKTTRNAIAYAQRQLAEAQRTNQQRRIEQIQNHLTNLQQQAAILTQRIQAAGGNLPGAPAMPGGGMPGAPVMPGQPDASLAGSLFSQDHIVCWANDFTVDPGKTYQYRMRLIFSNPLYRQPSMPASQQALANQFALIGQWSDWSEPVTSIQKSYYFLVSGNQALQSARIEIWKFYDGIWRKYEDNFAPGDPIGHPTDQYTAVVPTPATGGPAANNTMPAITPVIDFSTGAVVVDTDFNYKLLVPDLNISQTTLRVLFVSDGQLTSRTLINDKQRRDTLLQQLAPEPAADSTDNSRELQRLYHERTTDRAGRPGVPTGRPDEMRPDFIPPPRP